MRYLSVCSGIEAASCAWESLGWTPAAFAEIEPFPCSVLSHRFPHVPNLGDMTKFEEWPIEPGSIDVLVGGTPCQSFSIAGLRGGLEDGRGNLALTYCKILDRFKPRWFIWENVPGVLSSGSGKDFKSILDAFEELGYILDVEILDAQFFGVPQRRRRVFVCGENADYLLKTKTTSSVLTMAQCLVEILHASCRDMLFKSEKERAKSDSAHLSKDGVARRMKLFGITTDQERNSKNWQSFFKEEFQKSLSEAKRLVLERGERKEKELTQEDLLMDFEMEVLSTLTEESWRNDWEESLKVARSFITSTSISSITPNQISICFRTVLRIAALILHLRKSSPISYGSGLSAFAAIQDFMNYAGKTDRDLFSELDGIPSFSDLHRQARSLFNVVGHSGDWRRPAEVLFEPGCVRGDTSKGGKQRTDIANCVGTGFGSRGGASGMIDAAQGNHLIASTGRIAHCLNAGGMGRQDYETETMVVSFSGRDRGDDGRGYGREPNVTGCITETVDSTKPPRVAGPTIGVRRLTPLECERLQGFPDNWTDVPHRGRPAADGPRYKAIGNSMAVPVMRWIGRRILDANTDTNSQQN